MNEKQCMNQTKCAFSCLRLSETCKNNLFGILKWKSSHLQSQAVQGGSSVLAGVGGLQNCGQVDEFLSPWILLVGCRKRDHREMPRSEKTWARQQLPVDHLLVLNAGFILIANANFRVFWRKAIREWEKSWDGHVVMC